MSKKYLEYVSFKQKKAYDLAHVMIISTGFQGRLNCCFELHNRLVQEKHQVTIASPWDIKAKVEKENISYVQLPNSVLNTHLLLSDIRIRWNYISNPKKRKGLQEKANQLLGVEELGIIINEHSVDFLLIDIELPAHIIKATALGIPMFIYSSWLSIWKNGKHPSVTSDTIPYVGRRGTNFGIRRQWWKQWIKRQKFRYSKSIRYWGMHRFGVLKRLRKQSMNPLLSDVRYFDGMAVYMTFPAIPILSMTLLEMEFYPSKPPFLDYVGPMVYEDRKEKVSDELVQFLEKNASKKIIYCSLSSMDRGNAYFIQKLLSAVKDEANWVAVISLGKKINRGFFNEIPTNVCLLNWIPQLFVLSKAHLSINHGGINTIHECIHFKVPMLIYSGGKYDQNGCAARVHYHGIGKMAAANKITSEQINMNIKEVLSNPSYKAKVELFHKIYSSYQEQKVLENKIKSYFNQSEKS